SQLSVTARPDTLSGLVTGAVMSNTERILEYKQRRRVQDHDRPLAAQLWQSTHQPLVPGRAVLVGDHLRHDLGVARGREPHALARELIAEVARVDAVAVVRDRELAEPVARDHQRLRVLDARAAGRRVAGMAGRGAAPEG